MPVLKGSVFENAAIHELLERVSQRLRDLAGIEIDFADQQESPPESVLRVWHPLGRGFVSALRAALEKLEGSESRAAHVVRLKGEPIAAPRPHCFKSLGADCRVAEKRSH